MEQKKITKIISSFLVYIVSIILVSIFMNIIMLFFFGNPFHKQEQELEQYAKNYVAAFYSLQPKMNMLIEEWKLEHGCTEYKDDIYYCSKIDKYARFGSLIEYIDPNKIK